MKADIEVNHGCLKINKEGVVLVQDDIIEIDEPLFGKKTEEL